MPTISAVITETKTGCRVAVWLKPRAGRSKILGVRSNELIVAVAAPPIDGAANEELCHTLAEALAVTRQSVHIVLGASSRHKVVQVEQVTPRDAARALDVVLL